MSNELMHYGIIGMKWGIRRYQNADGTLTSAGKKRYDKEPSPDHYVLPDSKQPYELSNQELKDRNKRIELENKYIENIQKQATSGRKAYDKVKTILIGAAVTGATMLAGAAVKSLVDKIVGKVNKVPVLSAEEKARKQSEQILVSKLANKFAEEDFAKFFKK